MLPHASPSSRRPRPGGFTLTELLVVIALIVLLVGLLLAALGQVQQKAKQTTTTATMQAFSNACETFRQEHGFYPGFVPENVLVDDPSITGTENALIHLMGGFARLEDFADSADFDDRAPIGDGWVPFTFAAEAGPYVTRVSLARIGEGPIIRGKPYAPYFTPSDKSFAAVEGQLNDPQEGGNAIRLPDLVDAWGQPIVYLRARRTLGPLTDPADPDRGQFHPASMVEYCESAALGRAGRDQVIGSDNPGGSILSSTSDVMLNLGHVLEHPALPGQARGRFMLLSGGKDGVYFSAQDGPGSVDAPVDKVGEMIENGDLPPTIFSEYDDVLLFGGSS